MVFVAARGRRAKRALLLQIENLGLALDGGEFRMEDVCDFDGFLERERVFLRHFLRRREAGAFRDERMAGVV